MAYRTLGCISEMSFNKQSSLNVHANTPVPGRFHTADPAFWYLLKYTKPYIHYISLYLFLLLYKL